jgi:MYXO-CTERM domain-containing protein
MCELLQSGVRVPSHQNGVKMLGIVSGLVFSVAMAEPGIAPVSSVHLDHAELELGRLVDSAAVTPPMTLLPPGGKPSVWVYGYLPYWADNLATVPWDSLTHLAMFDVGVDSSGNLTDTYRWTDISSKLMERSEKYDVKVHLTLTCFSASVMEAVLLSPSKRAKVVGALAELVNDAGAHGVSVDFEGVPSSVKAALVSFVKEMAAAVDEVTVATPAVDWNGSFDYDELSAAADALFIMGYGYHWKGGDPGPISPLYGGGIWGKYSLQWSVEDHLEWGATRDSVVLGLPLYGRNWPSTSKAVPGTATGNGEAVVYSAAVPEGEQSGREYDEQTETPYTFPSSKEQLWYDDIESLRAKIAYAVDEGLLGIGFWALNYDGSDADLWAMVRDETVVEAGEDTGQTDTGQTDTDQPDTGRLDTNESPEIEEKSGGCACSTPGQNHAGWIWGLALSALLVRRRD